MHLLLSQEDSNWDLYDNGKYVQAIAKKGTWCSDSYFGGYGYFKRYIDCEVKSGKLKLEDLTDRGLEIYKKGGR